MAVKEKRPKRGHKGPGRDSTSAKAIATAERHAEWLELRKRGWTYRKIAAEHGVGKSTVEEAVSRALREVRVEPALELRAMHAEALDDMLLEAAELDEPEARLALQLKIRADQRKMLGIDAPSKVQDVTPRDDMWALVRSWLQNPTPDLESTLRECGWERKAS
jgi:hypothetical protein